MTGIYMYAHGGSGNHGCEAIVRSTAAILNHPFTLISSKPEEDEKYGVGQLCSIIKDRSDALSKTNIHFVSAYAALKFKHDFVPMDKLWYKSAFDHIQRGDVALSIGGDNYCYANVSQYVMFHDMLKKRGAKTVLWGCSVEPSVVERPAIAKDLARYDLIVTRESISYEALKKVNPNTILAADPAFVLKAKEINLPEGFVPGNTVGINLSPMAIENEKIPGIAFENYKNLITSILDNSDMRVALIPHVVWDDGDDRKPLRQLYDAFKDTDRVVLVDDHSCEELKYIISQCHFFIGARTHATIAAYSTGVPTLVLGYSVKARGIARDLFGDEEGYVLPVQELSDPFQLSEAYHQLEKKSDEISQHLLHIMPEYAKYNSAVNRIYSFLM